MKKGLLMFTLLAASLSGAAHACWDVVRMQAERLMEARTRDPLFNETNNQT